MKKSNDFDFLVGDWTVLNKRLLERLTNSDEWIEFSADYKSWHVLGGMGNMDEIWIENEEMNFHGLSMRIYNPNTKKWTIYWADDQNPENGINPQVVGGFDGKLGTFYGEEEFDGKKVKLRFIWESISGDHARWEQAYFDDQNQAWETNWTMEFKRKKA